MAHDEDTTDEFYQLSARAVHKIKSRRASRQRVPPVPIIKEIKKSSHKPNTIPSNSKLADILQFITENTPNKRMTSSAVSQYPTPNLENEATPVQNLFSNQTSLVVKETCTSAAIIVMNHNSNIPLPQQPLQQQHPQAFQQRGFVFDVPAFATMTNLPEGWRCATDANGNAYFVSDQTSSVSFKDPRTYPLPLGWEMRWDNEKNCHYFMDHINRITTFTDPRFPTSQQFEYWQAQRKLYTNGDPNCKTDKIIVNGKALTTEEIKILRRAGNPCRPGNYWYDHKSGAIGFIGGSSLFMVTPGLNIGNELQFNCSNGNTGISINGRELNLLDVGNWNIFIGPIRVGKYTLDALGNFGEENSNSVFENIFQVLGKKYQFGKSTGHDFLEQLNVLYP